MSLSSLDDIEATIETHLQQIAARQNEIELVRSKVLSEIELLRAKARSEIELLRTKIKFEKEAIALQKQLRNAHSPVNRFPPEVLARIFLFRRPHSWQDSRLQDLLRVTQVCAYWRMSALSHPTLWNLVPCQDAATTDWMLTRAKSADLVYRGLGHARHTRDKRREAELLQDMSRVQVLELEGVPGYLRAALHTTLERPAPVLETLELTKVFDDESSTPVLLFGGQLPKLRELRMRESQLYWQAPYLNQLSSLTLIDIKNKVSTPAMILILREMDRLQRLKLDMVMDSNGESCRTDECIRTIMPRLSFLDVNDDEQCVYVLLESLEAPALRDLRICEVLHDGTRASQILVSPLVSWYLDTNAASFTFCDIIQDVVRNVDHLMLSACRSIPSAQPFFEDEVEGSNLALAFRMVPSWLVGDNDNRLGPTVIKSMLALVQILPHLSALTVRCADAFSISAVQQIMNKELWPGFLRSLPASVTAIRIVDTADSDLTFASAALCALGNINMLSDAIPPSPPAPGLRRLTLAEFDYILAAPEAQVKGDTSLSLLRIFLEARAVHGLSLERLDLINCKGCEEEQLAELKTRGLVGEVVRRQGFSNFL
jgi:hypothetical protein